MLAEGERRASAAGIANVDWRQADPATAALDEYDLLTSAFGAMFFGDRVAAFTNMRRAAAPDARMALVCWRSLAENPWMEVPMTAAAQHLPPRPKPVPNAPGMFAFADRDHVTEVVTAAGWAPPRFEKLDMDLDIAAGRGLEEAVDPNRRREQLVAQPASRGRLGRRRLCSRGACALYGRYDSAIARRDVVNQQRACLNERRHWHWRGFFSKAVDKFGRALNRHPKRAMLNY